MAPKYSGEGFPLAQQLKKKEKRHGTNIYVFCRVVALLVPESEREGGGGNIFY